MFKFRRIIIVVSIMVSIIIAMKWTGHHEVVHAAGATVTWTGAGADNRWDTVGNWSNNAVPDQYDEVIFDATSMGNASVIQAQSMNSLTIRSGYTGTITVGAAFTISQDMLVQGGTFDCTGAFTSGGTISVEGGTLKIRGQATFNGDVNISGGTVNFDHSNTQTFNKNITISGGAVTYKGGFNFYGNLDVSGGTITGSSTNTIFNVRNPNSAITFNTGSDNLVLRQLNLFGNTSTTQSLLGHITISGSSSRMRVSGKVDLSGTITFGPNTTFTNLGTLTLKDGVVLDARLAETYQNSSRIMVEGTGHIKRTAQVVGFTTAAGVPVTELTGSLAYITLYDDNPNMDATLKNTAVAVVSSPVSGDRETVVLTETGNNTGIFIGSIAVVSSAGSQGNNQLTYDGSEDLHVSYTDSQDSEDTLSGNLHGEPIVWNGGGADTLWSTADNWVGGIVPGQFDSVIFDGTSAKNATINSNQSLSNLTLTPAYTGEISLTSGYDLIADDNVLIQGGTLTLHGTGTFNGNVDISGGTVTFDQSSTFNMNVDISEGTVTFTGSSYSFYSNLDVSGGTVTTSNSTFNVHNPSLGSNFNTGSDNIVLRQLNLFGNPSTTLSLLGDITISGSSSRMRVNGKVDLSGTITFGLNSTFTNLGTLTLKDGAVLDARLAETYQNSSKIMVEGTGHIKRTAQVVGFTTAAGVPVMELTGSLAYITLHDDNPNMDGTLKNTAVAVVSSPVSGDSETVVLTETDNNTGIFIGSIAVVSSAGSQGNNQLTYDGSEDMHVSYTDSQDADDTLSRNLNGEPIVWNGGGADTLWSTADNWVGGIVPGQYDSVVFDGTSAKNTTINSNRSMLNLTVTSAYSGQISLTNGYELTVGGNVLIQGGTLAIHGKATINGNVDISGGTVIFDQSANQTFNKNVTISGGTVSFTGYRYYFSGSLIVTDAAIITSSTIQIFISNTNEQTIINMGDEVVQLGSLNLSGSAAMAIYGNYQLNHINGLSTTGTVHMFGHLAFKPGINETFTNDGTLVLEDGAFIQLYGTTAYNNNGQIIENGTGQINRATEAMGITDAGGNPALTSFRFGQKLIVSLIDRNRNLDGTVSESVYVTLQNWTNFDTELLYLTETGVNTGEFRSDTSLAINTSDTTVTSDVHPYDGIFQGIGAAAITDAIQIIYMDPKDSLDEYLISINSPSIKLDISELSFPFTDVAADPLTMSITIMNNGDSPLIFTDIYIDALTDFNFAVSPDLSNLAANQSRTIIISYDPTSYGFKDATLFIETNDRRRSSVEIPLTGHAGHAPTTIGISDIVTGSWLAHSEVSLFDAFDDIEDEDGQLTYSITQNTYPDLFSDISISLLTGNVTFTYNSSVNYGSTTLIVRAEDSDQLYTESTFIISRSALEDVKLSEISLSSGVLNETFTSTTTSYTQSVTNSVTSLTLTPIAESTTATVSITVNGDASTPVASGSASPMIPIAVGDNIIAVVVTAEDGTTTNTYTITITRANEASDPTPTAGDSDELDNESLSENQSESDNYVEVIINGIQQEQLASATKTMDDGNPVITIHLDPVKIHRKLEQEGLYATVTLPVSANSGKVIGELTGQTVKDLEGNQAVLEIQTEDVSYRLPAALLKIDDISTQLGKQITLSDIKVHIEITMPTNEFTESVKASLLESGKFMVLPPIQFEITAEHEGKTVSINQFSAFVEREIAVPQGIDPNRITTGIAENTDGTWRHVPTIIIKRDDRFYAQISSLTNSIYSVIWHPVTFPDMEDHWARMVVNDMGSRLIASGMETGSFSPDENITRSLFVDMLVKALGLELDRITDESTLFSDVTAQHPYSNAIYTASANGLVSGYTDGKFHPGQWITREEAMLILAKTFKLAGLVTSLDKKSVDTELTSFEDHDKISVWARSAVAINVHNKLIKGDAVGLRPMSQMTRAEAATAIWYFLSGAGLINNKPVDISGQ